MVEEFNSILMELLTKLYSMTEEAKFKKVCVIIRNASDDEERKYKFIEQYIIHFLKFKDEIYERNSNFFLQREIETESSMLKEILSLKHLFQTLSEENKDIVIDDLIKLTRNAEIYFYNKYVNVN